MICQFLIYVSKKIIELKKYSSFNWFYTFSHVNPPGRDMKKKNITSIVSRPFHRDTHQFTA